MPAADPGEVLQEAVARADLDLGLVRLPIDETRNNSSPKNFLIFQWPQRYATAPQKASQLR